MPAHSIVMVLATVTLFAVLGPLFGILLFGIAMAIAVLDLKGLAVGMVVLLPPFTFIPYWFGGIPALATGIAYALISLLTLPKILRLAVTTLFGATATLFLGSGFKTGQISVGTFVLPCIGAGSAIICALLAETFRGALPGDNP